MWKRACFRILSVAVLLSILTLASAARAAERLHLSLPLEFMPPAGSPQAVELADIDLDGILDAVVVIPESSIYDCYHGAGDGTFTSRIASGSLYLEPTDLVVGDFNSDGLPDIAAINSACSS